MKPATAIVVFLLFSKSGLSPNFPPSPTEVPAVQFLERRLNVPLSVRRTISHTLHSV